MIRRPPRSPLFPYPTLSRSYDGPAGHHPNMAMIYPLDIEAPPLILDCLGAEKAMDVAVRHFDGVKLAQRCPHVLLICSANLRQDRKSTRLNSSHLVISYAVF